MWSIVPNLGEQLRRHWAAYTLAFAVGVLVVAPYAYFALTPEYRGVALMGHDAEEHYLARMQEVYDGHPSLGNTYLPFKETPYLSPGLGENAVAYLGMIVGLSAAEVNLVAKFIFPAVIFLLLYGFALEVSQSRATALLAATVGMLGTTFMSSPGELLALLRGNYSIVGIVWGRPINPEVSALVLFGVLWLLYRFYTGRTRTWASLGAISILTGSALYISPYVWSFLGACIVLLCIYYLWRKEYTPAVQLFGTGTLALLLALPFVGNTIAGHAHPGYAFAALKQEILASRAPVFGTWVALLLLVPLMARSALGVARLFFIFCAVALVLVLNQQVVTGIYVQPGHYHWYITKPLAGILLGLLGGALLFRFSTSTRLPVISALIGLLFIGSLVAQVNFYHRNLPEALAAQAYAPLITYFSEHPSAVVFANRALSTYLPLYTSVDAPNNPYAVLYFAPTGYFSARDELIDALDAERPHLSPLLRGLGATLVVKDTTIDTWDLRTSGLVHLTTIDRFDVYALQ